MSDLNLNFDSTGKEVSLDGDNKDTGITLNEGSSSDMLGIDLLSNKKNTKAELNVTSDIGGYSSDDGYAYQMMGVYEGNIGQTATILVGYYDNYGTQWLDSIKVMIDE